MYPIFKWYHFLFDFCSNLILVYWDILQDSTTHRNFLLRKLFLYNAMILGIKATWKIKFDFLILRIFRLSRLLRKVKISAYLFYTYFPHFAKSHYFILRFQDNVARLRSLFWILHFFGIQLTFFYFSYFFFPFKFFPRR